jgi:hypothetical protein
MTKDTVFHSKELILQKTMVTLIIALDCGIKSIDHVAYAKSETSILLFVITTDLVIYARSVFDTERDDCTIRMMSCVAGRN